MFEIQTYMLISERIQIAVKGSLNNPGTGLIKLSADEYDSDRRNISESSLAIPFFYLSIKSRQIFNFVACSEEIAPSTAVCISSIDTYSVYLKKRNNRDVQVSA